jgi:hypothetical protein
VQSWIEREQQCARRLEPILDYRAAQALMDSDSAVVSVFDKAFPLEAIHEEADTRPCGADHFGK